MASATPTQLVVGDDAAPAPQTGLEAGLAAVRARVEVGDADRARALLEPLVQHWPDSSRVRYWARILEPAKATVASGASLPAMEREHEWLRVHRHEYPGCWLAVHGDRLIAADPDLGRVYRAVREAIADTPAVIYYFDEQ